MFAAFPLSAWAAPGRDIPAWLSLVVLCVGLVALAASLMLFLKARSRLEVRPTAQGEQDRVLQLLDTLPAFVCLIAPDYTIRYGNEAFRRIFGDSVGKLCHLVMKGEATPCTECGMEKILGSGGGEVIAGEREYHGSIYWVFDTVFTDADGSPLVFEMGIDISHLKEAERLLHESEERYRQMFERHSAVKLLIDPGTGEIVDANPSAATYYGHTCDQLRSMRVFDINRLPRAEVEQEMARAVEGTKNCFEFPHTLASGEVRQVQVFSGPVHENGRDLLLSIVNDITDRKLAEERLRGSQAFVQGILDASPNLIYLYNIAEKRSVFCNRTLTGYLGYTTDEIHDLEGGSLAGLLHPDDAPSIQEARRRQSESAGNEPVAHEFRMRHADGSWHWIETHEAVFRRSDDGTPVEIIGIATDITERKAAADALHRSEAEFRSVFESSPLGIALVRTDTRAIVAANEAYAEITGRSCQELASLRVGDVTHPEDYVSEEGQVREVVASGGRSFELRKRYLRPDGTVRWCDVRGRILDPVVGSVPLILAVVEDITGQLEADRERDDLIERLHQAEKLESLRTLAGGVAHHFNNLLHAILGLTDLAMQEMPPETPGRENLFEISTVARRAAELSMQMLSCSGRRAVHLEPASLNRYIQGVRDQLEAQLKPGQRLWVKLHDPLPDVEADGAAVRQILTILMANAVESLPETPAEGGRAGHVSLRTGSEECTGDFLRACMIDEVMTPGLYAWIEVEDNGSGMDEDTLAKVYDPFFSTKFTGRGLGLPTVLGLTRAHRGCIQITSVPDKGTRVRVYFPALAADPASKDPAERESRGTVLVADDDASIRVVARRLLETNGYRVVLAKNGKEAVEYAEAHPDEVSCVLLDLLMPVMNGFVAYARLRETLPGLPVIVATGYNRDDWSERLKGPPPDGFLQKPYNAEHLLEMLDAAIRR
jgi:two-component system, cell cycle sensor histidine kinase and response regulator CckA